MRLSVTVDPQESRAWSPVASQHVPALLPCQIGFVVHGFQYLRNRDVQKAPDAFESQGLRAPLMVLAGFKDEFGNAHSRFLTSQLRHLGSRHIATCHSASSSRYR